ncbi:ATP-dependent Clp protease adapter ClpS [Parvibium lacunae]|uniref:ATP-dependent Clp protease adapter protein ClpS n=1 Tax=Parvibium lacunae TaxID=1888893 RepID=A0A368L4H4_9BURK|nr:ATP-dependent Clp protease adapter ClpS [Parvibium lacunae]RCS58474.1 ATP-dependent Clp protease adapter ClpS [Parvibium lacunae]
MNAAYIELQTSTGWVNQASPEHHHEAVLETEKVATQPPPLWQVVLLNDDYTPMEFVVYVLEKFFGKSAEQATQIMLKVHHEGKGVCGVYPKDIAATKVELVREYAQLHHHPLQCDMEVVD